MDATNAEVGMQHWIGRARTAILSSALTLLCASPQDVLAQVASARPAPDVAAAAIAAAEAEGAAHPRALRTRPLSEAWDSAAWWGTAERRCLAVRGMGPARSGEFIIGGELGDDPAILPRTSAKIWWAPLHNGQDMDSLVVTGTRLSSPMQMRLAFGTVAFPVRPGFLPPESEREYFFPSGTVIPDWGRWLLVATSGANWGCFIVTLGRG